MKKGGIRVNGIELAARYSLGCSEVRFFRERKKILEAFLGSPNGDHAKEAIGKWGQLYFLTDNDR